MKTWQFLYDKHSNFFIQFISLNLFKTCFYNNKNEVKINRNSATKSTKFKCNETWEIIQIFLYISKESRSKFFIYSYPFKSQQISS